MKSVEDFPCLAIQLLHRSGPAAICIVLYDLGTLLPIQDLQVENNINKKDRFFCGLSVS